MLKWALMFFVISLVAGVLGFTGMAAGATVAGKILFLLFLAVAIGIVALAVVAGKTIFQDFGGASPPKSFGRSKHNGNRYQR